MPKDMVKAAGSSSRVLLENAKVRVIELNWKTGVKIDMHAHPNYIAYGLATIKYKSKSPDGKVQTRTIAKGEATWNEAESHAVENAGPTGRAIIIELK